MVEPRRRVAVVDGSRRRLGRARCLSVAIVLLVLATPGPGASQARPRADAQAFVTFLQSIAVQHTARTCERGDSGYRQRFDQLYGRWSARHRDRIHRGEAIYYETVADKNLSDTDRATLERMDKVIAELAQSPRDTGPITLDDHMRATCAAILQELEAGLGS